MNKSVLKSVLGGIAFGAIMFFAGPFILLILLLKFIFTPFGMGRMMYRHHGDWRGMRGMRFAMADKIRSMSEEEFTEFKNKMNHPHYGCC
ncbi:MAG: hypothetical protein JNM95_09295 [Chitinophagaceae bacterium]|nr:hypothetical protein [Chitinophagaceae bacterium]